MQDIYRDIVEYPELWDAGMQIYRDSFDVWEREDEEHILEHIRSGIYKMFVYLQKGEVVGFYILDTNPELSYTLFSFLAIKESCRGRGLGTKLCLNAIEYFHNNLPSKWLLIEAQERQARLYAKLGFHRMNLEYLVPAFDSNESIEMSLMLIEKEQKLDKKKLSLIIEDIFSRGYSLDKSDSRIEEQLKRVDKYDI